MASRPPEQDQIEIPPGGEDGHTPEVKIVADAATGGSDERQVGVAEHSASALRRATDRRRSIRWMSKVNAKFEAMVKIPLRRERVEKFISLRKPGHANELHSFPLSPKETQHNGIFYSVTDLLATGFLEGLPVTYVFKKHNVEIPGIIKGDKYACGCSLCNYKKEISAREFEKHAEVTPSSQASNHIVLENGMTLHGIVKHLEEVPVKLLREKMEMAIGRSIDPNQDATWINDKVTYKDKMNLIPPLSLQFATKATASISALTTKSLGECNASYNVLSESSSNQRFQEEKIFKYQPSSILHNVKGLLTTGLLEGIPVKYKKDDLELQGLVADSGISCGCSICNFKQVVSSLMFEKHAQSKSSNPNNHIFLENGMTLYALVKLLKGVSLGSLGEVIKEKTGCLANMKVSNVWTGDNQNNGVSNAIQEIQMYDAIRCQKSSQHNPQLATKTASSISATQGLIEYNASDNSSKSRVSITLPVCIQDRKKFKYQPSDSLHDVKGLLATGLLEGFPVKYKKDDLELQGFIADSGISCGCNICDFKQIVSSLMFEKHAQSKSNNQNNHIFLENGTSLYALVKLLRGASLGSLGEVIVEKIGCPVNMKVFNAWTELFNVKDSQNSRVRNTSHETKMHGEIQCKKSELHVNMKLACKRLQNEADDGLAKISELHTLDVKRRECRNHTNLLNLIHELPSTFKEHDAHHKIFDILEDGTRLSYHSYGKEILTGYKSEKGIICCCCNDLVSPSQFEAHAGNKKKRKPYHSIYTSIGKSLHELAMIFYKKQNIIDSCSKDQSMVHRHRELAKYTGYLKASLGEQCSSNHSVAPSTHPGWVFEVPCNLSGCKLCRDSDATLNFGNICDSTMIFCGQCNIMFHAGCLRVHGICNIKERPYPPDSWLCGDNCKEVCANLFNLLKRGSMAIPSLRSIPIKNVFINSSLSGDSGADLRWQLLGSRFQGDESSQLLNQAARIFQDAFGAVYKQNRDVLSVMVKGEKGIAEFFGGMLCAVVTVKSVIISAALLRVFGQHVAELPLAVTIKERRGEGYFTLLFSHVIHMLKLLKVRSLILPADDRTSSMWINRFGFSKLNADQILEYRMNHPVVIFKDTIMLQKSFPFVQE